MIYGALQVILLGLLYFAWLAWLRDSCILSWTFPLLLWFCLGFPLWSKVKKYNERLYLGSLRSKYWFGRWDAVHSLSLLESPGESVISALENAKDDPDKRVRKVATWALKKIADREETLPKIVDALKNKKPDRRARACMKLAEIGFDAAPALPKLKELAANDPEITVRNHAKRAIAKIEPLPYEKLVELLDDHNWLERKYAAEALGYVGTEAKRMLPKLKEIIEFDDSRQVRDAAKITIARFEGAES